MTDYLIWRRGLRGPSIAVNRGHAQISVEDRNRLLSGPTPIKPEHEGMSLALLAAQYPPPAEADADADATKRKAA